MRESTLGKASDVVLELPKAKEACPHGLAPTTSTTMQLALGDCLAIALLEAKGFTARDFKVLHPGGSLGAQLKFVADLMHTGERLPLAGETEAMGTALVIMTQKALGCLGIVDAEGKLVGVITDGDLRRHMGPNLLAAATTDIMTKRPKTIGPRMLASAALELINSSRITPCSWWRRASQSASCTCTICCGRAWLRLQSRLLPQPALSHARQLP